MQKSQSNLRTSWLVKNPCCYSVTGTWDPWSVVQRFNHLGTKHPVTY